MRKLFWGSAALAFVTAAAVYVTADYAARNPQSVVGRCANAADHVGRALNPFSILNQLAATARQTTVGQRCEVPPPGGANAQYVRIPKPQGQAEQQPVVTTDPAEVIQVGPTEGFDPRAFAEALGVRFHLDGTKTEGADEVCEAQPQTTPPASNETQEPVRYGVIPAAEEDEQNTEDGKSATPAEQTDPVSLVMPYAEEDVEAGDCCGFCKWVRSLFRSAAAWTAGEEQAATTPSATEPEGKSVEDLSSEESGVTPPDAGDAKQGDAEEQKQSDSQGEAPPQSSYHHEYQSCPYLHGCPYPYSGYHCPGEGRSSCTSTQPEAGTTAQETPAATDATATSHQEVQPRKPAKVRKPGKPAKRARAQRHFIPAEGEGVYHSDVDTLEYRPSDGNPNAFANRWF